MHPPGADAAHPVPDPWDGGPERLRVVPAGSAGEDAARSIPDFRATGPRDRDVPVVTNAAHSVPAGRRGDEPARHRTLPKTRTGALGTRYTRPVVRLERSHRDVSAGADAANSVHAERWGGGPTRFREDPLWGRGHTRHALYTTRGVAGPRDTATSPRGRMRSRRARYTIRGAENPCDTAMFPRGQTRRNQ